MAGATETLASSSTRGGRLSSMAKGQFVILTELRTILSPSFPASLSPCLPPSFPPSLPHLSLFPSVPPSLLHPLRYEIGGQEMPLMRAWMEKKFGLDLSLTSFSQVRCLGNKHSNTCLCKQFNYTCTNQLNMLYALEGIHYVNYMYMYLFVV